MAACSSGGSPRRRGRRCSGLAAQRLGRRADELEVSDGTVRAKDGSAQVSYGALIGDRTFAVAVDPRAPLKDTQRFRYIGRSLPRPDVAAKVTGQHHYLNDPVLPKMLHARVVRPPSPGATLRAVDASSIASVPGAHVVRLESFLGVVDEREWDVVRAAGMLKSQVEGNIIQTLSRALHEEIVYDPERVTTVDWATYPILTMPEVPAIEVELIQRLDAPPLGAGEAASAPVPAALSNAVFDATGVRLRTVPFRPDLVKAALARGPG